MQRTRLHTTERRRADGRAHRGRRPHQEVREGPGPRRTEPHPAAGRTGGDPRAQRRGEDDVHPHGGHADRARPRHAARRRARRRARPDGRAPHDRPGRPVGRRRGDDDRAREPRHGRPPLRPVRQGGQAERDAHLGADGSGRGRRPPRPDLFGRDAPATRPRGEPRRLAPPAPARRADDRARPRQPQRGVGRRARHGPRRHRHRAHHAVPRRGRPPRRRTSSSSTAGVSSRRGRRAS